LAAIGSAVGLGNVWRFPYMAYENGGGAFLIPYFFALLTAGIPMLVLEFGVGRKYKGSAPIAIPRAVENRRWEWLGWWQALVNFVISLYYAVIVGWALSYFFLAFDQGWTHSPSTYFFNRFLDTSSSPLHLGSIQWHILIATLFVWFMDWIALLGGVKRGIEAANKVIMPVLLVLFLIMLGRTVTLPHASEGLQWLFKPNFAAILNYRVWAAAYGQIFFSMSIGFGIMITYSSYLPADSDVNNNAFITGFINSGFSLLSGIVVFGVLGHMAAQKGVPMGEVISSGVGLAFVTIPAAINMLPASHLFGTLFFLALVFAGLSSLISISESCCAALMDKYGWSRPFATAVLMPAGACLSLLFVTRAGLLIVDIVDHFINNFGIVFAGLVEVILLAWFGRLRAIREHVNRTSDFCIGSWWNVCLKLITPAVLGYMAIANLVGDISKRYGNYPADALVIYGWCVVAGIIVSAFILQEIHKNGSKGPAYPTESEETGQ
jgi:NSS family neurotransmitter:Na+ symporter